MAMKAMLLLLVVSSLVSSFVLAYDHEHGYSPAKAPGHEYNKHHDRDHALMHAPKAHDHDGYDHDGGYGHHPHSPMHAPDAYDRHHHHDEEHRRHEDHDHHHDEEDHRPKEHDHHHDEHYKYHSHSPTHPPEAYDHHHSYDHYHHRANAPRIAPMHSEHKLGAPIPYMADIHICIFKCKHYCEKDHQRYHDEDHDKYDDKDHHKKWRCVKKCIACCEKCKCVPEGEKKCMKWDNVYIKGRKVECP